MLHVRARILNSGMHVLITKHRTYDKTFEKISFLLRLQLLGEIPDLARFIKKCAPGHQAPKTASDGASGAYFQVGF